LYPFVVIKVNIFIDQLLGFFKGRFLELAEILFFEMPEEVLHGSIVPTVATSRHARRDVILLSKDIMNVCEVYWCPWSLWRISPAVTFSLDLACLTVVVTKAMELFCEKTCPTMKPS